MHVSIQNVHYSVWLSAKTKVLTVLMLLNPTWICNMVKFCFSSCCIYPWRVQSTCLQYLNVSILITHISLLFIPRDIVSYCHCLDHFYSSTQSFLKKTGSWKKPWFKPKSWKKPVFIGFFQDFGFFTIPGNTWVKGLIELTII